MKVLTISNCPLDESQGSGYVILNFCRGLRERGHHVDLFGPESYEALGFLKHRARSHRRTLGMPLLLVRSLRRNSYDVIEFYGGESWLCALLLRLWRCLPGRRGRRARRILVVSHSNGLEPFCAWELRRHLGTTTLDGSPERAHHRLFTRLQALAFRGVDGVITVSNHEAAWALEQGYQPREQIVAIENPLPQDFLGQDLGELSLKREPIVGYCGSWLARKGSAILAAGMSQALQQRPELRLHLIGVGGDFRAFEHFPADVCARVEVTPSVAERAELRRLYNSFLICILPSAYESFGLAGAEAMACGCALVATPTGFAASLHHGEEALLLEEHAPEPLRRAVLALLEDDTLRRRVACGGHARVQSLRWTHAVETLESTYSRWLERQRKC